MLTDRGTATHTLRVLQVGLVGELVHGGLFSSHNLGLRRKQITIITISSVHHLSIPVTYALPAATLALVGFGGGLAIETTPIGGRLQFSHQHIRCRTRINGLGRAVFEVVQGEGVLCAVGLGHLEVTAVGDHFVSRGRGNGPLAVGVPVVIPRVLGTGELVNLAHG